MESCVVLVVADYGTLLPHLGISLPRMNKVKIRLDKDGQIILQLEFRLVRRPIEMSYNLDQAQV